MENKEKAEKAIESFKMRRMAKPSKKIAELNNKIAKEIINEDEKAKKEIEKIRKAYNEIFNV